MTLFYTRPLDGRTAHLVPSSRRVVVVAAFLWFLCRRHNYDAVFGSVSRATDFSDADNSTRSLAAGTTTPRNVYSKQRSRSRCPWIRKSFRFCPFNGQQRMTGSSVSPRTHLQQRHCSDRQQLSTSAVT